MKNKTVGIIQSNFIPWQGYFDFINCCDEFILFDDVQYTERDWRNRNRLKTSNGQAWINVPVIFSRSSPTSIDQTPINHSINWIKPIDDLLIHNYKRAKYFDVYYIDFIKILKKRHDTISQLNEDLIYWISNLLNIKSKISQARSYKAIGSKTDRLLELLVSAEATAYISGPSANSYIEVDKFKNSKIDLFYKSYSYNQYNQLFDGFIPGLSVLDLLLNEGPQAPEYIRSKVENIKVDFNSKLDL